jgi:hypothetical protein
MNSQLETNTKKREKEMTFLYAKFVFERSNKNLLHHMDVEYTDPIFLCICF